MSSVVFRSSVLIFLLLLFNGGSIAFGALPYFYGPAQGFQIIQLAMASAAFIITLLLPCFVIAKHGRGVYTESLAYLLITLVDIAASVLVTLRWVKHTLEDDYKLVPKAHMIVLMVVCVSWAASLTGFIGFFLGMIDSCSRALRKDKTGMQINNQGSALRELKSAPYAQPHTTYMRPDY